ncbi:MAG: hypothetical protein HY361_03210, partial [Candidatus Aenigmarchaeota archaeon]|nr:hypothetical protein [Candidatus Aenigmarchaeota archaeon]
PYSYRSNIADNVECDTCVDWFTEISNIPPGISNGTSVFTINASSFIDAGAIKNNTLSDARLSNNVSMSRDVYSTNQSYNRSQVYNKTEVETLFVNQSGDTISGNLTITANLNVTGQSYLSNLNISGITFSQGNITANSFIPSTNITEDLGSPSGFFRNLYIQTIILLTKITGAQIADETITSSNIQNASILSGDIAEKSINTTHIINNTIKLEDIATGTLNNALVLAGENISTGTINNDRLNSNISQLSQSISQSEIENASINSMKIASYQINNTHITLYSVNGSQIASMSINNSHVSPYIINNTQIMLNAVNGSQIIQSSINNSHIASFAINNTQIALSSINNSHIASFAINNTQIALSSINTSQIIDGTINHDDISQNTNLRIANLTIDNNLTINDGLLFLDTLNKRVGIGTLSPNATFHIIANDTNNATISTIIILDHDLPPYIASNGSNGSGLSILFRAKDSKAEMENLSRINAVFTNAFNGSETSSLEFLTRNNGSQLTPKLTITGEGVVNITNNATIGNLTIEQFSLFKNNITAGNITPSTNNTASLGSNQTFFKEVYVNLLHIITKITGAQIADETIASINIQNKSIQSGDIGDAEINSTHIKDEQVGSAEIQNLSIQSIDIASYQINNTHLVLNSINGSQIMQLSINNSHIASFAINNTQIMLYAINNSQIALSSINDSQISNVNASKILAGRFSGNYEFHQDLAVNGSVLYINSTSGFISLGTLHANYTFQVLGNASFNNTLFITNLGRIGINVSNPNRLVQIQGDTNISDVFFITGNRLGINVTNPNRVFQVQGDTNLSDVLFTTGSRVGINTTSPSTALDIQGAVNISSATSGKLLQIGSGVHGNLTMFSVDGTRWTCGVLNSGAFNCTSF